MLHDAPTPQRTAVCRTLLEVAALDEFWEDDDLLSPPDNLLAELQTVNPRGALILQVVMAIVEKGPGPSLEAILALPPNDLQTILMAPLAARNPRLCPVWLALTASFFNVELPEDP